MIALLTSLTAFLVVVGFFCARDSRKAATISTALVLLVVRVCLVIFTRWRERGGERVGIIEVRIWRISADSTVTPLETQFFQALERLVSLIPPTWGGGGGGGRACVRMK